MIGSHLPPLEMFWRSIRLPLPPMVTDCRYGNDAILIMDFKEHRDWVDDIHSPVSGPGFAQRGRRPLHIGVDLGHRPSDRLGVSPDPSGIKDAGGQVVERVVEPEEAILHSAASPDIRRTYSIASAV